MLSLCVCVCVSRVLPELPSEFAVTSHRKAAAAIKAGKFKDEIVPMTVQVRMHDQTVQQVWRLM